MDVAVLVIDLCQTSISDPTGTNHIGTDPTGLELGLGVRRCDTLVIECGVLDKVGHVVAHLIRIELGIPQGIGNLLDHRQQLFCGSLTSFVHGISLIGSFHQAFLVRIIVIVLLLSISSIIVELDVSSHILLQVSQASQCFLISRVRHSLVSGIDALLGCSLCFIIHRLRVCKSLVVVRILDSLFNVGQDALAEVTIALNAIAKVFQLCVVDTHPVGEQCILCKADLDSISTLKVDNHRVCARIGTREQRLDVIGIDILLLVCGIALVKRVDKSRESNLIDTLWQPLHRLVHMARDG